MSYEPIHATDFESRPLSLLVLQRDANAPASCTALGAMGPTDILYFFDAPYNKKPLILRTARIAA